MLAIQNYSQFIICALFLPVMPDLIPAKDGIHDRHPETDALKQDWIPDQVRNDKMTNMPGFSLYSSIPTFRMVVSSKYQIT